MPRDKAGSASKAQNLNMADFRHKISDGAPEYLSQYDDLSPVRLSVRATCVSRHGCFDILICLRTQSLTGNVGKLYLFLRSSRVCIVCVRALTHRLQGTAKDTAKYVVDMGQLCDQLQQRTDVLPSDCSRQACFVIGKTGAGNILCSKNN